MEFRNSLNFILCLFFIYLSVCWFPLIYKIFIGVSGVAAAIKFAEWLMTKTRQYILHKKVCCESKAILITGCDSGFGHALAKRMFSLGYAVFAACLFPEGDGAMNLQNYCSEKMKVFQLDVTNDLQIEKAKEFVKNNLGQNVLWAIVNNAGILHIAEVDWVSLEDAQKVFDVNTLGMLRVTKAFLPFLKESHGRIINVTSFSGRHIIPSSGIYSMSKSGSICLTSALRMEMAKWDVKAISVEPFFYQTSMCSAEIICAMMKRVWMTLPEKVKDEYGEDYIESITRKMPLLINSIIDRDISKVTDCLEDAITAQEPLSSYISCTLSQKVLVYLLYSLPNDLVEYILTCFLDKGTTKPLALKNKKIF